MAQKYTSTEVKARYNEKHYDQMSIVVPKGSRELIKEHANSMGLSVSEYIRHLIAADAPDCLVCDLGGGGGYITLAKAWNVAERLLDSSANKNKSRDAAEGCGG